MSAKAKEIVSERQRRYERRQEKLREMKMEMEMETKPEEMGAVNSQIKTAGEISDQIPIGQPHGKVYSNTTNVRY